LGAIVTGGFNYLSHQGDLDAKMIELSVGILRAEPTPETAPLREWAIESQVLVQRKTEVRIAQKTTAIS
jgi:hypothetical protein